MKAWGNQHISTKGMLTELLDGARAALRSDMLRDRRVALARSYLATWAGAYATVPASTQRRWRCGR